MRMFPVSPLAMLLLSAVGLSVLQIGCSECEFGGFSILGQNPSPFLVYVYIIFGLCVLVGYFFGGPLIGANMDVRAITPSTQRLNDHLMQVLASNFLIIAVSQYFMGAANIGEIIRGNVSAQDIEEVLRGSPFGIHGLKLIAGFYAVVLCRACYIADLKGWRVVLLHLQAVFIFLSSAKIGGMLFWVASLLSLGQVNWKSALRFFFASLVIVFLFVVTRILRNPGMELTDLVGFVTNFIFGLYLGSPVVNANFLLVNPEYSGSVVFLFSHLLPHKVLPVTLLDLMKAFPDPTSPLGIVGAAFGFLSYAGVMFVGVFCGFLTRRLEPKTERDVAKILFFPFLVVACAFSVMYQHFFNLTFFWIPLVMSSYVSRRYFRVE